MAMTDLSPRSLLAYLLVAGAALIVGYALTSPLELMSFAGLLSLAFFLLLPLILRWHHALLVMTWNASMVVFFLPGDPYLWMLMTLISLSVSVVQHLVVPRVPNPRARPVAQALLVLALVVLGTAMARGGFGVKSLGGSSYGGKHYFYLLFAILGYFALAAAPIPAQRAPFYAGCFILGGLTALASHLIYFLGPAFYFLYGFFRVDLAISQAQADYSLHGIARFVGLGTSCFAVVSFMLLRYGIRGLFSIGHPARFLVFVAACLLSLFSGFRSILLMVVLLFSVQLYFERLLSLRVVLAGLLGVVLAGALLVPFASRLPLSVQRTLTILPLDLDPVARLDALSSSEWRLKMWTAMLPDLPRYALLGKGYAINPAELALSEESARRGFVDDFEMARVAGDYHNGPLSVFVPFGSAGLLAFLYFLWASLRLLHRHYREGNPALLGINTLLLSLFVTNCILFFFLFGALSTQLCNFAGIVGLSVALNRGEARVAVKERNPAVPEVRPFLRSGLAR